MPNIISRVIGSLIAVSAAAFALTVLAQSSSAPRVVPLERVVAVVNDEALTQFDIDEQKRVILQQMQAERVRRCPTTAAKHCSSGLSSIVR